MFAVRRSAGQFHYFCALESTAKAFVSKLQEGFRILRRMIHIGDDEEGLTLRLTAPQYAPDILNGPLALF